MAALAGIGVREAIELALDYPALFLQLDHDAELLARRERAGRDEAPSWRMPGESATEARDRLRRGREEARRRQVGG